MKTPFEWMPDVLHKFAHEQLDKAIESVDDYRGCTASHLSMHTLLDEALEATKDLPAHEFLADISDEYLIIEFVESNKFNT